MKLKTRFTLAGFKQEGEFRVLTFDDTQIPSERTQYKIRASLVLVRKHGIHLQELPLLCCDYLENHSGEDGVRAFTFTEGDMVARATKLEEERREAALRRKMPRKPAHSKGNLGSAWRTERIAPRSPQSSAATESFGLLPGRCPE